LLPSLLRSAQQSSNDMLTPILQLLVSVAPQKRGTQRQRQSRGPSAPRVPDHVQSRQSPILLSLLMVKSNHLARRGVQFTGDPRKCRESEISGSRVPTPKHQKSRADSHTKRRDPQDLRTLVLAALGAQQRHHPKHFSFAIPRSRRS
jgi:hypothetical protein